jgi:hypothetical protein
VLFTDKLSHYSADLVGSFAAIVFIGAIAYMLGILSGYYCFPRIRHLHLVVLKASEFPRIERDVVTRARRWMLLGISLMFVSFMAMGFVPALAANPLQAKFFRGDYYDSYSRVALFYRTGRDIVMLLVPLMLCIWLKLHRRAYLILACFGTVLLLASLTRQPAVQGIIVAYGIYVSKRGKAAYALYLMLVSALFCLGSVSYYVLFAVLGLPSPGAYDGSSLATLISSGAPDLTDSLTFLGNFLRSPDYTNGLTCVGGLVPYHFQWNPSVWALHVMSPNADINNIVSGGLRLPLPLWGYVCFGWLGVVLLSYASGLLNGGFLRYVKGYLAGADSLIHICVVLLVYFAFYKFIGQMNWSLLNLPASIVILSVVWFRRKRGGIVQSDLPDLREVVRTSVAASLPPL